MKRDFIRNKRIIDDSISPLLINIEKRTFKKNIGIMQAWVCQVKCVSFFDFFGGRVNRPPFCICN